MSRAHHVAGALFVAATIAACACPPTRCGPTPELLLTVRAGDVMLAGAVATVLPEGNVLAANGCARAGADWGCTHELGSVPGRDELRSETEGTDPGHGGWRPNVDIPVRLRVESADGSQEPVEVDVVVHVDACGLVESPHVVVDLLEGEAGVEILRGPHGCERP